MLKPPSWAAPSSEMLREGCHLEHGFIMNLQMKNIDHLRDFLNAFINWAVVQDDVQAIALVGSYARGAARDDSDIDLVLLTDQPQKYLDNLKWIERFGNVDKYQTEDYGKLISIRVWYLNSYEVEYGITMSALPKRPCR